MAITVISTTIAPSPDGYNVTTAAIDTTGANLLLVGIGIYDPGIVTGFSDSKGNSWSTAKVQGAGSGYMRSELRYCIPTTVGTGHTFTLTASTTSYVVLSVLAVSGAASSSVLDQQNGASDGDYGVTTQPGSVTPTQNDELLVFVVTADANAGTVGINSGFTIAGQVNKVGGFSFDHGLAYKIQTTAGAENPTYTESTGYAAESLICTFKAAAGATSNPISLSGSLTGAGSLSRKTNKSFAGVI